MRLLNKFFNAIAQRKPILLESNYITPTQEFSNKTALVFGGGTGIGKAIAEELKKNGADVIICGRTEIDSVEYKFRKIDVSSDVVEMIHQEITPGAYGTKYGLDGCLYSIPGDGSCIWKYDVILDTIYMMYNLEDDSKAKYAGGLTLPNGEIVFVPATSSTIMVLKPERYMRIPESFYKAFCQDNY